MTGFRATWTELQGQLDALTTAALTGQGSTGTGGVLHPLVRTRAQCPVLTRLIGCQAGPAQIRNVG